MKDIDIFIFKFFLSIVLLLVTAFALSEPVPGFRDGTLQLAFVELRQVIDLFLSWDWTNYVAEFGKDYSKYLRVNPQTCIVLLEK